MTRRAGLARKKQLARTSMLRSGKRLAPVSGKRQHRLDAWPEKRQAAFERAGYRCEMVTDDDGHPTPCERTTDLHPHHRLRRSQGGSDELENLVILCAQCHRFVHDYPEYAVLNGWLVSSSSLEALKLRGKK